MKHIKKVLLALVILLASYFNANSQYFDGVYIGGSLNSCIEKYKAKGYTLSKTTEISAIMKGKISNTAIELYIFTTPKTKVVSNVAIYLPKYENWYALKTSYNDYVRILTDKYGKPDDVYTGFVSPYYEGDGYEMSAVELEKNNDLTLWFGKDNTNIGISISKFKQVKIQYENVINLAIKDKEQAEIDKNSF